MQPEYQVETWCKNCLFAEYTDNTQTGCKLGRHKIFNPEENTKEEDGVHAYVFDRSVRLFAQKSGS